MKILLVRPGLGVGDNRRLFSFACQEPLALALLAGLTPDGHAVRAIDDRFEPIPYRERFDLVALSVGTFQARRAYAIADRFRAAGVPVVLGGFHPTACPDEAAAHADVVAVGEAEGTWPAICADAEAGRLRACYDSPRKPRLAGVMPDRRVFAGKRYAPLSVVQLGRGCPHACDYCSVRAFYRGGPRQRPVTDVLAEIRAAGRRRVFFADDNLLANREAARELLAAIRPLGLRWTTQLSIDVADDEALLAAMAESGCQSVIIGFESLSAKNLAQMGKGWSPLAEYGARLARLRRHGIMVWGTFVFGYDDDDADAFAAALDFARRHRLFLANFNHLQPYPGTPLYDRLAREGRLRFAAWWLDPAYRFGEVAYEPRCMSAAALGEACQRTRAAFHSLGSIAVRAWDRRANARSLDNLFTHLTTNLISRADVHAKYRMRLGSPRRRLWRRVEE